MMFFTLFAAVVFSSGAPDGATLYRLHCSSCHGAHAEGSGNGPSLTGASATLVHFMLDTGRMPASAPWVQQFHISPRFSAAEIDALTTYVVTLDKTTETALPKVGPGNAQRGRTLYQQNCEHCHGAGGEGAAIAGGYEHVAPSLMHASVFQVAEAIRAGPDSMPRFDTGVLSDADVNDIARYVNTLQTNGTGPGGITLSNLGPVPEGFVAWVFGLGLLVFLAQRLGKKI